MNRELNDEQKEFIQETLSTQEDYEIDETEEELKIVKVEKPKKVPAYKDPKRWFIAIAALPIILIGFFFVLLGRVKQLLGGSEVIELMVKAKNGGEKEMISQGFEQAGHSWVMNFLVVYEYRWIIVIALVVVWLGILILSVFLDSKKYGKEKETEITDDDEDED